ncbi:MAG: DUF1080 domain-containing protein, partial [Planctomycetes bacterium]|nr:DUF1080 domain-containing protein [Planctomycetota bacterium]
DEDLEITIKQPGKEPIIEVVNKKTKRAVTLTAIDGEIIVKDLLGDFQQKTTALHLTRGDKKTFHARVLLGEPVARMDAQFLQGSWLAESAEENGSPLEPEQRREIRLTFDGETVRLQSHMLGGKDLTGLYTLSPGKQPKEIVMMSQDRPAANKSWNFRGIYRFDKDRLTICLGTTDKGPIREFKTLDAESPRLLLVLRREAAFQPLFNGKDLTGWVASSPEKKEDALSAWSIEDGILKGKGRAWPVSLLHTGKDFENYVLKLQFRLPSRQRPTSGSGLILHANKGSEDRNGIHIDLRPHGDSVRIGVWKSPNSSATGIVGNTVGLIPMGEWNDLLIHSKAGTIEIWVNSKLAGKAAACTPSKGSIAFINLDSPTEYRNIEIKEMPSGPPEPGFQPLFNGKDLDGWSIVKSPGKGPEAVKATWDSAGSFVRFQSQISSCLRTSKRYQDYELKLEYRYPTPLAKSGSYQSVVILRMQDTLGWPAGIHVSLMESTTSGIEAVGVTGPYVPLSGKAKPGDWNQLSITCRGRSVSLVLNGQAIGTARAVEGGAGCRAHDPPRQYARLSQESAVRT